jgi:hypothetical protein
LATAATTAATPTVTPQGVQDAFTKAANDLQSKASSKKSLSSDRFMELQLSFTTSEMSKESQSSASFTQTSWSVDLFFGSASGQSSTSQAASAEHDIDSSTEIQIGLKAAKVDIDRGWFNPGIFKITDDMNRISKTKVSLGAVDPTNPGKAANDAIMPCFPVSFVVAKDITITFKANESSLDAIHSVLDQKSAAGGGFLCFSVSSSSSSHNESSSFHTKTTGQVINITIPGPQILGWFLEFTPVDNSDYLTPSTASSDELTIIDYVGKLEEQGATEVKVTANGNGKLKAADIKDLAGAGLN